MSNHKFTEGDWKIGSKVYFAGKPYGFNIAGGDGYHVCKVSSRSAINGEPSFEGENFANALAISNIPKMVKALEAFVEMVEYGTTDNSIKAYQDAKDVLDRINPDNYIDVSQDEKDAEYQYNNVKQETSWERHSPINFDRR